MLLFLLWLPFEDTEIWFAALLALDLCIWLGLRGWPVWIKLESSPLALAASSAWLAAIPTLAIALMAFKSGLHGHGFADFTANQVGTIILAIPICFFFGGVLGGLARILGRKDQRS